MKDTTARLYFQIEGLELSEIVKICQLTQGLETRHFGYLARVGSFAPTNTEDWLTVIQVAQQEISRLKHVFSNLGETVELTDFVDIAEDGHALTGLRYNRGAWFVVITHRWDSTQLNSWGVEFYCPAEHSQYAKFRLAVADAMASHRVVTNKAQKALSFTL